MNKQMGNKRKQAAEWIYQYRFALAFILLILLVSFKMNSSSMGCWRVFLGDAPTGVLLGGPRAARSDEWGTLTPLCFRQQYNTLGAYNRYSQTIGLVRTDNMLVYGQPAWDILTLFRPFYWGYLFFGSERGLSWFWCARLLVLFLSWFELGMLISDGQKKLSVMLGICVSWAPFIQWWFAINDQDSFDRVQALRATADSGISNAGSRGCFPAFCFVPTAAPRCTITGGGQ